MAVRSRVARLVALTLACSVVGGAACSSSTEAPAAGSCADIELLVATSDYKSSVICGAPGCTLSSTTTGSDLGGDPQLSSTNGRAFFLAREKDTVFEVSPSCGRPTRRFSVHAAAKTDPKTGELHAANPHDIAAAPDGTLVIPLFDAGKLLFVKSDGTFDPSRDVIDLSVYDPDGNPQPDAVRVVNVNGAPKAFITLERLDDTGVGSSYLLSKQPSQMLRVDVATRMVEAAIDLAGRNPFNHMSELAGSLFMAEPGNFNASDEDLAGIERFDTKTSTSQLIVRERDLGGSVAEIAVTEGCGAAIIAGPQADINPTALVTFDPATGRALTTIRTPVLGPTPGYDLQALTWRGDLLYVGDRRPGPTGFPVHVFQRTSKDGCVLVDTGRRIDLPQSPVALRAAL